MRNGNWAGMLLLLSLGACQAENQLAPAVNEDGTGQNSDQRARGAGCLGRQPPVTIALSIGQSQRLSQSGNQLCFRFPDLGNSRYVLAYADPRLADQALTMPEWPWPDSVQVEIADRTTQMAAGPTVFQPLASPSSSAEDVRGAGDLRFAVPASCTLPSGIGDPYCRTQPWTPGETFILRPNDGIRPPQQARVLRVSGHLVVAIILADSAQVTPKGLARLDTALAFIQQRVLPFLWRVYAVPYPVTTQESGQLLLMLEAQTSLSFASAFDVPPDRGRFAFVSLRLSPGSAFSAPVQNANSLIDIISHELTHTFQYRWKYGHGSWTSSPGTAWSLEGSATFVQHSMTREFAGIGFLSEFQYPQSGPESPLFPLGPMTYAVKNLPAGYGHAASFLRDLVQRVTEQGFPFEEASSHVLVGALEGWHGVNEDGVKNGVGLTARMQPILGSGWNPRDALLTWTTSQTADDVTTNPVYQNRTITSGGNLLTNTIVPHTTIAAGSGGTLAVLRGPGTTGTVILDDSVGGTFSVGGAILTPSPIPMNQLEWLILRVK